MQLIHLRFFVPLVVKSVVQKKQDFEGGTLIVKPYEESMKMDHYNYQVFHNWCNGFYNSSELYKKVIFTSLYKNCNLFYNCDLNF